ncbi:type I 3-dehydroquinate dehydratase [Macrococcoides caseolyticum]|uniref:type I 3-dehydroquinate dehydratase n=1 Tax=Macrococcoides caseolyticum TaxID=69966 RepID=UPI001F19AC1E|nr:type I 3-dehydroquinate dehydratase [Macrococcus caseolyticus]MCE4955815.1 type I 3-dehydroquinate dehydratase [Macrococcus caseolyticus]
MSEETKAVPKVILTLSDVQNTDESIIAEAIEYIEYFDVIEYRADMIQGDINDYAKEIQVIKEKFPSKQILFTYRTEDLSGKTKISMDHYYALIKAVIEQKLCDIIDLELMMYEDYMDKLLVLARANQILVLISHHEYEFTPRIKDMLAIYERMIHLKADYCKLAVKPHDGKDVLNLMSAVYETKQKCESNIIGIAMEEIGKITRVACGVFGSSMTFGYVGKPVAPGQIHIKDLHDQISIYKS